MLELKNIIKNYSAGENEVHALKGIDLCFKKQGFVSILGPSGCGKTTLLNIIGGLDRYTAGDLIINGKSTSLYRDRDWDSYRNHSIGFVFQSYNLIPHQSVLQNVELALTLSGVSKKERRERLSALEKEERTFILHEAPHKLKTTLEDLKDILNDRKVVIAKELTKIHEKIIRGTIKEIITECENPKGEYIILIEGTQKSDEENKLNDLSLEEHYKFYENQGLNKKDIIKKIAKDRNVDKNEIYMKFV